MCTFNDDLEMPKFSTSAGAYKAPITMFLKAGDYRFRLLKYTLKDKNDRDFPFIERHIHDHWSMSDKGFKLPDDTVVCLKTKYVKHSGNRKSDCPMCRAADEALAQWKNSSYKDPIAAEKYNAMKSKYQGVIPVFVVTDPNNKKNNDQLRCFFFSEKSIDRTKVKRCPPELNNPNYILCYDDFVSAISRKVQELKASNAGYTIWNGKNAVDLVLRVSDVPVKYNAGTPREKVYNRRVITGLTFTKTPYDIDKINEQSINAFQFDDQYYVKNDVNDIQNFLDKNYGSTMSNVPDEVIDFGDTPVADVKPVDVSNTSVPSTKTETPVDDVKSTDFDLPSAPASGDLATDPDNDGLTVSPMDNKSVMDMIEELPEMPELPF